MTIAVAGARAETLAHRAAECFATGQGGADHGRCSRLHLAQAQAAYRQEHAALRRLIPRQGRVLLADSDRAAAANLDAQCGTEPSAECLTQAFQERTARLVSLRRLWQMQPQRQRQGRSAPMARASPALDPGHDGQVREFWRWVHSFAGEPAPSEDSDGSRCGQHQPLGAWFLAGNARGGAVHRTCTLPSRPLVVPVMAVATPADPGGCAETRLYFYAQLLDIRRMEVRLDGAALPRSQWPRMHMACMPHPDGKRALLTGGWWLYLPPLSAGAHRLAFSVLAPRINAQQDVVYDLVVQ